MNERTTERTLNEQMDKINQFKIFQIFLSKYVDVTLEDLLKNGTSLILLQTAQWQDIGRYYKFDEQGLQTSDENCWRIGSVSLQQ